MTEFTQFLGACVTHTTVNIGADEKGHPAVELVMGYQPNEGYSFTLNEPALSNLIHQLSEIRREMLE